MTYDQAIHFLRQCEGHDTSELGAAITAIEANHALMIRRWKCWRDFTKRLWSILHEGGPKGMAADCLHRDDYRRMKNYLA